MMQKFLGYQCSLCGQEYTPDEVTYTCPKDGGNLNVVLDYANIRKNYTPEDILGGNEPSLWRYLPLLPVPDPGGNGTPLRAAGWTPVFAPGRLAQSLGMKQLWVKDESRNPSASFKDRASAVVVGRARAIRAEVVVTASTGNAGAALARSLKEAVGLRLSSLTHRCSKPRSSANLGGENTGVQPAARRGVPFPPGSGTGRRGR